METKARQLREPISDSNFTSEDVNAHFRRLDDGRTVFYPMGLFGRRGFIVASTKQETLLRVRARGTQRRGGVLVLAGFLGMMAIGVFTPLPRLAPWFLAGFGVTWLAASWAFLRLYFRRFTEGMESAHMPNSPIVYWRSQGQTMHPLWLIVQFVGIVALLGCYFFRATNLKEPEWLVLDVLWMVWLVPLGFQVQGCWRSRST